MGKRKRSTRSVISNTTSKRSKTTQSYSGSEILQPLLNRCYREVKTLYDYVLHALPATSRVRRKKLRTLREESKDYERFFNSTLVGDSLSDRSPAKLVRLQQLTDFTQRQRASKSYTATQQHCTLDEVIDFSIWSLFEQNQLSQKKPNHILCHGLERSVTTAVQSLETCRPVLPGILERRPNACIQALKGPQWRRLMSLAGDDGETVFSSLLLDCSIFIKLDGDNDSYYQLSGIPVHDLCLRSDKNTDRESGKRISNPHSVIETISRSPSCINIVRNRVLYGKPSLNRNGGVSFGLRRIHILNRLCDLNDATQDLTVLRHMFPRQFRLHNVFTSKVDKTETVQPFKDYTFREDALITSSAKPPSIPQRLKGRILPFVRKLRRRHRLCSFDQLIAHYCPLPGTPVVLDQGMMVHARTDWPVPLTESTGIQTQAKGSSIRLGISESPSTCDSVDHESSSLLTYSTSATQVSSFCCAVLRTLLPKDAFGTEGCGDDNWMKMISHVQRFVHMRKFETVSLHELLQGLKLRAFTWLEPQGFEGPTKLAATDKRKRGELLHEFVYYLFDSILTPLLAANFYVTESGVHRSKLMYFRHDVWQRLSQPCLASAQLGTLVPISAKTARSCTASDQLGYSVIRLLPKDSGVRFITNLRRRSMQFVNGRRFLAQSINSRMAPVFNIFNYEKQHDKGIFDSHSLSIQNLHGKIASYKSRLNSTMLPPLYFVKVDIRSAFDSIPQQNLLELVGRLFRNERYYIARHAESRVTGSTEALKTTVKFVKSAAPSDKAIGLNAMSRKDFVGRRQVVYSDADQYQHMMKEQAKKLLSNHIQTNIIRIGNKYHMQTEGIPQGSILSSLLCTFFYNDFEQHRLGFLSPKSSLLLRVIDDFLLITTEQGEASDFVRAMKAGDARYGIFVHPEKSLVNFDMCLDGIQIPKLASTTSFPFCGLHIDTHTLQVSKDRVRKDNIIANALTVDFHGHVGDKMKRRMLSALRIQLQGIVLDTGLNEQSRVLQTLIECFQETSMKLHQYYKHLPFNKRPNARLLIDLIKQFINLVYQTMKKQCTQKLRLTRQQMSYLAAAGIIRVLRTKSGSYQHVLQWLEHLQSGTQHSLNISMQVISQLVEDSFKSVQHFVY